MTKHTSTLAKGHPIDLPRLLETRLLIQANSGGGKSWALRRILEQTANQVQQLVIDPEGEFASLREKFDYIVCAPRDADAIAHPRTAKLLARRLLESGVSAILDIYDLRADERKSFVRIFCDSLVNAPKKLWHPVLVILDEAHVYAPEKGSSASLGAVIDLASRGRKRGFCLCAATQRLSKLHKDVAAEMNNKMIGRTGLDIDVRRAADELGMTRAEATKALRTLDAGEWFVFGPALSKTIDKIKVGPVKTTHPKVGERLMTAPPAPSTKVRKALAELADLPQQAEEEARTLEDYKKQLADTRRQLRAAEKQHPETTTPVDARKYESTIKRLHNALEELMKFVIEINARDFTSKVNEADPAEIQKAIEAALAKTTKLIETKLEIRNKEIANVQKEGRRLVERIKRLVAKDDVTISVDVKHHEPFTVSPAPAVKRVSKGNGTEPSQGLTRAQQHLLDQLAWLESHGVYPPRKETLAAVSEVSPKSGGYFNNLGRLRSSGLIDYPSPGSVGFTDEGRNLARLQDDDRPIHERWLSVVTNAQSKILRALIEIHPEQIRKDELAEQIGVSPSSGGYFNNLGRLRTIGAINYPQPGFVELTEHVIPRA